MGSPCVCVLHVYGRRDVWKSISARERDGDGWNIFYLFFFCWPFRNDLQTPLVRLERAGVLQQHIHVCVCVCT